MDLFEAISRRHTYRGPFLDLPVIREDLIKIVRAGLQAPSGVNAQSTSFVIVDDPELLAQIYDVAPKTFIKEVRALIVCVIDPAPVYHGHTFAPEDCAVAIENMLLAVTALGYATVWVDGFLRLEDRARRIGNLLGVPPAKQVRVLLPIGRPAEPRQPKEKLPFEKRAWFNHYGA